MYDYFLDDGSLIIDKHTAITYIPSEQLKLYDLLNNKNIQLDPNGLSSNTKRKECMRTGAKKVA